MNKKSSVKKYEAYVTSLDPAINDHDKRIAVILLAAVYQGTNPDKLAKWSGYTRDLVREIALRMKGGRHWTTGNAVILGDDLDYLVDMVEYVTSKEFSPLKEKKPAPKVKDAVPDRFEYSGSSAPFSVGYLRSLHSDISGYRRSSASSHSKCVSKRPITDDEWDKISASIDAHELSVIMRTSSFGFKLGVDIMKPPSYPGAPVDYIMHIPQDAVPSSLIAHDRLSPGDASWNPVTAWNSAWDLFGSWVFTKKNMESVKFSGINMPVRKSDYSY